MAEKIIGNLDIARTAKSKQKYIATSVNDALTAGVDGNLELGLPELLPTSSYGDVVYFDSTGNAIPDTTVKFARIVDSDSELSTEKNYIESFQTVFNSWYRFSCGANGLFPSNPSEIQQWTYNAATDSISNPLNSTTLIGFVSPEKYTDYDIDVQVKSTAGDDDWIGIVLAFSKIDGKEYTLTASRSSNSKGLNMPDTCWSVLYNHMQPDAKKVADGESLYNFTRSGYWSSYPNGCKIKASRRGNVITVSTTDLTKTSDGYVAQMTIDLESDPILRKFINPSSIGYSCQSQGDSTWKTLFFSGGQNIIYDIRDGSVWYYDNSTWSKKTGSSMYQDLNIGHIYSNSRTGKAYYYNTATDFSQVIVAKISKQDGNTLQELGDGLYRGSEDVGTQKTFYVNGNTGNDNADGTINFPLKTIQAACKKLVSGVYGYTIHIFSGADYEISKPITLSNVGVHISPYPVPAWVEPYLATHPNYEWTAAAEIQRPRIFMNPANMENTPAGYIGNAFQLKNFAYLSMVGPIIEPGTPPGTMRRTGFFGNVDQTGTIYLAHCVFKVNGLPLLNSGGASDMTVQMYRCMFSSLTSPAFIISGYPLSLAALGNSGSYDSTDPAVNPYWEHPFFSNPNFTTQVRDGISGVTWYNGVPTNCNYEKLYGGPTYP